MTATPAAENASGELKVPPLRGPRRPETGAPSAPVRACVVLFLFVFYTVPMMPVQALLRRLSPAAARRFPMHFHRGLCRLIGVRVRVSGVPLPDGPCLIAANHCSWLDITALSSTKPLSFIAKQEVAGWPFFGTLARLQRTLFVDRERRTRTGRSRSEMQTRLEDGDTLVLFAEGTSSDGNRVLPFRTALFGAADTGADMAGQPVPVQPVSVAYSRRHGLPMGRRNRALFAWYGDMEILSHIWGVFKAGPIDVDIHFHPAVRIDEFDDRKALARHCENRVRASMIAALRGRSMDAGADLQ